MDEETRAAIEALRRVIDENFKTVFSGSVKTDKAILELKEQVGINCTKLDKMKENTDLLPQMFELVQANGQGIEDLSGRIDKLEK